jgi:hypothetical protein
MPLATVQVQYGNTNWSNSDPHMSVMLDTEQAFQMVFAGQPHFYISTGGAD